MQTPDSEVISVWPCGHGAVVVENGTIPKLYACHECGATARRYVPAAALDEARADLAEMTRERDEARHDLEAVQAYCNLTQSELDDLAVMLGVRHDAPYGEVKTALARVLAGDVDRLRDLANQIERSSALTEDQRAAQDACATEDSPTKEHIDE